MPLRPLRKPSAVVLPLIAMLGLSQSLHAARIESGPSGLSIATGAPGNDGRDGDVDASVNLISGFAIFNALTPSVLTFNVANSTEDANFTTEYRFQPFVVNFSGVGWEGLRIDLHSPEGGPVPGLRFDHHHTTSQGKAFPLWITTPAIESGEYHAVWNAEADTGELTLLDAVIDVPNHPTADGYSFEIVITPLIPEPGVLSIGIALGAVEVLRRRRC